MIESLRGQLIERSPAHAVVECHGVGYLVHISASTYQALPEKGDCRLHTHYAVSVDVRSGLSEHKLFGFVNEEERRLFRLLITVQGVSTTIGLAILGARGIHELRSAIMNGDESVLKSVKGIGPKLAQRIVTELRQRLVQGADAVPVMVSSGAGNTPRVEALSALVSLGLDRAKAERALQTVLQAQTGAMPTVEELIKLSLKNL
ncbi:MAG TPA: Holliday junction branch migration protein RuvA [Flavobacteriales bacterium]